MKNKQQNEIKNSEGKLELAQKIASQSKKVAKTYATFENYLLRTTRWISGWVDRFLFNQKYGKVVALCLAVLMFVTVTYGTGERPVQSGVIISDIPVSVNYAQEVYEIEGIPTKVNVSIVGEQSDVLLTKSQGGYSVEADLTGLSEGTHQIKLTAKNFSPRVDVKLDPSTAVVRIKKKTTWKFELGYDYMNTDKIEDIYILGAAELETTEVMVRAAQETLESIAFVKAWIDVTGANKDFEKEAIIVAYNQNGEKLNVTTTPEKVKVKVPVSSPSKAIPIKVIPDASGTIPNGMAISEIILDQNSANVYAPDAVLNKINELTIPLPINDLTKDTKLSSALTLPSGVKHANVSKVNMEVKLGLGVNSVVADIPIMYMNNVNHYAITSADLNQSTSNVNVFGTQNNLDTLTKDNISVYIDCKDLQPGVQEVTLYVIGSNPLVKYSLVQSKILVTVSAQGG